MLKSGELIFRAYFRLVLKRFWQDIRADLKSGILGLVVAVAIVFLQYRMRLLPWDQTGTTVLTRVIPYGLLILGYIAYHGFRASWKCHKDVLREAEEREHDLAVYGDGLIRERDRQIDDLKRALELPNIVGEILHADIQDVQKDQVHGILAGLVSSTDVRVTLQVRLSNGGRVRSTVERCELKVDPGYGGGYPGELEVTNVANRLDFTAPIEFGVPRTGWVTFMVRNTSVRSLVKNYAVLTITDGTLNMTETRRMLH